MEAGAGVYVYKVVSVVLILISIEIVGGGPLAPFPPSAPFPPVYIPVHYALPHARPPSNPLCHDLSYHVPPFATL